MKAPSDHIRTLQRRVDFLKSREHKNSFDLAELGALEWALVNLPSSHDTATELLKRCENEMRYAGWDKFESDNTARNGVYEQVKQYLEKNGDSSAA